MSFKGDHGTPLHASLLTSDLATAKEESRLARLSSRCQQSRTGRQGHEAFHQVIVQVWHRVERVVTLKGQETRAAIFAPLLSTFTAKNALAVEVCSTNTVSTEVPVGTDSRHASFTSGTRCLQACRG